MIRIPKIPTCALAMLLMTFALSPEAQAQTEEKAREPDVVVHVQGMACSMCARSMHNAITEVEGVEAAEVLLEEQKVLVTLKEGQEVSEEMLEEAVTGAGYVFRKAVFSEEKDAGENGDA